MTSARERTKNRVHAPSCAREGERDRMRAGIARMRAYSRASEQKSRGIRSSAAEWARVRKRERLCADIERAWPLFARH
jgi:hypothetical protein